MVRERTSTAMAVGSSFRWVDFLFFSFQHSIRKVLVRRVSRFSHAGGTMDISFNPADGDEGRRLRAYQGELTILPPSSASCALVEFARDQIEAAFAPCHPQHAHGEL